MRLAGKVALITGGGRGIGRVIALTFAREGADIAICARTEEQLKSTAAEVEKLGRRCFFKVCDVTINDQCAAVVQGAIAHFGRLDILVNNAGGGDVAQYSTVGKADDAWWFDNIALNLHSTFFFCRAVLPSMIERRYGRIVNVSSVAGLRGLPHMASYAAAKARGRGAVAVDRPGVRETWRHLQFHLPRVGALRMDDQRGWGGRGGQEPRHDDGGIHQRNRQGAYHRQNRRAGGDCRAGDFSGRRSERYHHRPVDSHGLCLSGSEAVQAAAVFINDLYSRRGIKVGPPCNHAQAIGIGPDVEMTVIRSMDQVVLSRVLK